MKLLCVIYSIHGGGAEKQMQQLLQRFDRSKFQLHLAVFRMTGNERTVVPDDVVIHDIGTRYRPSTLFLTLNTARLMRRLRPDRVLSFLWSVNLIVVAAAMFLRHRPRIVIAERTYPGLSIRRYSFSWLRKMLIRFLYPRADAIVAVSSKVGANLTDEFKVPHSHISVIYNGVDVAAVTQCKNETIDTGIPGHYIVSVGNLNATKNYPSLLRAFAEVAPVYRDLHLMILGEGDERAALHRLINELSLNGRVTLTGTVANPYPYMARALLFVLCSRFEGLPNVVLEAMACRTPVLAARCPSGIEEIINDGVNGILSQDASADALAAGMRRLLDNEHLRRQLAEEAFTLISDKFPIQNTLKAYEELLQ